MTNIELLKGVDHLRAELRGMDNGQVIAQELVQKGAMHAVRFLLEEMERGGDFKAVLLKMRQSLREHAMVVSEECARRHLPVVHENG